MQISVKSVFALVTLPQFFINMMLKRWVQATFILSLLVIIAGGIVRTTQSGMGCPDWPKCFGKWIPPTQASELPADFEKYLGKQDIDHRFNALHTWIEYINRLLGALLGLFALIQAFLLFRERKVLRTAYRISLWFLGIVILTGLFGAIVVKLNLAHASISVHLLFAIILVQVQLALLLSMNEKLASRAMDKGLRNALYVFLMLLMIQSVLGTMVRMHVDDVSKLLGYQYRDQWIATEPTVFILHRSFSWLVLAGSFLLVWYGRKNMFARRSLLVLAALIVGNMVTGIILFYAGMPAPAQPVHLLLATLMITQLFYILLQQTAVDKGRN